ncbi:MAG: DNA-binding response OmpR family regulator [Candidatus Omnitrophota bacterium]|jgi:DNA-binding response OmpR family regulator
MGGAAMSTESIKKILIIDDCDNDSQIIKRCLQKEGYVEFDFAAMAEEGLQKAAIFRPDIVILDMALPDGDGFETCIRLKSIRGLELTVILSTGYSDVLSSVELAACSADGAVAKSTDCIALIEAIKKLS